MKKTLVRILVLIAVSAVLLSGITVCAAPGVLEVIRSQAQAGGVAAVPIKLSDNPGLIYLTFDMSYDRSLFAVKEVRTSGDVFAADEFLMGPFENETLRFTLQNSSFDDNSADGILATVYFNINERAKKGNYDIGLTLDPGNTINSESEEVALDMKGSFISIVEPGKVSSVTTPKETGEKILPLEDEPDSDENGTNSDTLPNTAVTGDAASGQITEKNSDVQNKSGILTPGGIIIAVIAVVCIAAALYYVLKLRKH